MKFNASHSARVDGDKLWPYITLTDEAAKIAELPST